MGYKPWEWKLPEEDSARQLSTFRRMAQRVLQGDPVPNPDEEATAFQQASSAIFDPQPVQPPPFMPEVSQPAGITTLTAPWKVEEQPLPEPPPTIYQTHRFTQPPTPAEIPVEAGLPDWLKPYPAPAVPEQIPLRPPEEASAKAKEDRQQAHEGRQEGWAVARPQVWPQ